MDVLGTGAIVLAVGAFLMWISRRSSEKTGQPLVQLDTIGGLNWPLGILAVVVGTILMIGGTIALLVSLV